MKKCTSETTSKLDRKTVERNRRIQMKGLCFKLASMVPPQYYKSSKSKEMMTQQGQLDLVASYIKQLTERIENLKERKEKELRISQSETSDKPSTNSVNNRASKAAVVGSRLPVIKMSELGSCIEVMLISGLNKNFMFYEVISVLEEEGAEVVSANSPLWVIRFSVLSMLRLRFLGLSRDYEGMAKTAGLDILRSCTSYRKRTNVQ